MHGVIWSAVIWFHGAGPISRAGMCAFYNMVLRRREKMKGLPRGTVGTEVHLGKACLPGFWDTFCCSSCSLFSWRCTQCYYTGSSGNWDRSPSWSDLSPCTGTQNSACPDSPGSRQRGGQPSHAHISPPPWLLADGETGNNAGWASHRIGLWPQGP